MDERIMMEQYIRLSESPLWDNQRYFFEQQGIAAWQTVPFYVTSNPLIAKSYANIIIGYLRDCLSEEKQNSIDVNAPIYIIELGSGTGRFSFYFIKYLFDHIQIPLLKKIKIIYVITDVVLQNVQHCREQLIFEKYINEGVLDFALFDVVHDKNIQLMNHNHIINRNAANNPILFIANYIFDGMRNDLFMIKNRKLYATHIATQINDSALLIDAFNPDKFVEINNSLFEHVLVNHSYYDNEKWNALLSLYDNKIDEGTFLFPVDALLAMNNLNDLSHGRFLLLSADRGDSDFAGSVSGKLSEMGYHGSLSIDVNFYLLEQYILLHHGLVEQVKRYKNGLNLALFIVDINKQFPETQYCFKNWVADFNSYDFLKIKKLVERVASMTTLEEKLAILQLSHWDQKIFAILLEHLNEKIDYIDSISKHKLLKALEQLIGWFYPSDDEIELLEEINNLKNTLIINVDL